MSILQTIRKILTREKNELLEKNTPEAARLAATFPGLYTHNATQRTLDRKMIDGTVSRYYLAKGKWTYSWYGSKGHVDTYEGSIHEWRPWCCNLVVEIGRKLKATASHQEYLERVSSTRAQAEAIRAQVAAIDAVKNELVK